MLAELWLLKAETKLTVSIPNNNNCTKKEAKVIILVSWLYDFSVVLFVGKGLEVEMPLEQVQAEQLTNHPFC